MAAFGPSQNQKNAQGSIAEIPRWVFDQMKTGYGQAADAWLRANGYTEQYVAQLNNVIQKGYASPDEIRALGEQAMPGIQDLANRQEFRVNQQAGNYANATPVQATTGAIDANMAAKAGRIGENFGDIQGAIDTGFGSQRGRTADTAGQIGGDIAGTYSGLQNASDTGFGTARQNAAQGFGAIGQNAANTYGGVRQRILQGRDLTTGTTARAFAPAMAAAQRRLRMGGVDPNSPEAQSILQNVDAARGRAFDDTQTAALNELNRADIAQQQNQQGLDLSKLSNDQMLALQNVANKQGLSVQQYLQRTNIAEQTRDIQNALDQGNMAANITNVDTAFQRGQSAYDQQAQNAITNRALEQGDVATRNALLDKQNAVDLSNQGLKNQVFNTGVGLTNAANQRADQALNNFGNVAGNMFGVAQGQQGQALNSAQVAQQGFGNSYALEAPNAGWATKALAGAAGPLITLGASALPGGAVWGPILGKTVSGVGGGWAGQQSGGGDPWAFLKRGASGGGGGGGGVGGSPDAGWGY